MDLPDYWRHPLPDMCPRSCLIWARLQRTEQGGGAEERGGGQGVRPDGGVEVEESDLTSILGRCHAKRATSTPIRHTVPGRMELFCLPHGAARRPSCLPPAPAQLFSAAWAAARHSGRSRPVWFRVCPFWIFWIY